MTQQLELFEATGAPLSSSDHGEILFPGRQCGDCPFFTFFARGISCYPWGNCNCPSYLGHNSRPSDDCMSTRYPMQYAELRAQQWAAIDSPPARTEKDAELLRLWGWLK